MIRFELDAHIVLRQFTIDDADSVYRTVKENYDHLRRYMHWMVPDYSLISAREFISHSIRSAEEGSSLGFGIFSDEDLIGSIGFVSFDENARRTELGYWIAQSEEGKGIVSKSCETLIDHAFNDLGLNRIEIRCSVENVRSSAIPERFGFTREGLLRQSEWRDGRLHDFYIYGLLAEEWPARKKALALKSPRTHGNEDR